MEKTEQDAKNAGWRQCEYYHPLASDMWWHPDALECEDGHYISTEEMLEIINK